MRMLPIYGYCQCGCGSKVGMYKQDRPLKGIIKGTFQRYLHGHNTLMESNPFWKGGKAIRSDGYAMISIGNNCHTFEHILMCEKVLGKSLPKGVVIHHVNEKRNDNHNGNFVICQNIAYHMILHKRIKALKISGHADWEKCQFCGEYDDTSNIFHSKYGQKYHRECKRIYQSKYRKEKEILKCTLSI
jgi:hypothetical protein